MHTVHEVSICYIKNRVFFFFNLFPLSGTIANNVSGNFKLGVAFIFISLQYNVATEVTGALSPCITNCPVKRDYLD